jgi:hypothetical protein
VNSRKAAVSGDIVTRGGSKPYVEPAQEIEGKCTGMNLDQQLTLTAI